jgi:hypothetical protein
MHTVNLRSKLLMAGVLLRARLNSRMRKPVRLSQRPSKRRH